MAYLSSLGFGAAPLSRPLEGLAVARSHLAQLRQAGFRTYSGSEVALPDLICRSIAQSLAQAGCAPSQVDALILATESMTPTLTDEEPHDSLSRRTLSRALLREGVETAYLYSNGMSGCANLLGSVELARCLVEQGTHERVLVVAADRCPDTARVMPNGAGIYSDAAACCLVTKELPVQACFRIDAILLSSDLRPCADGEAEGATKLASLRGMRAAVKRARRVLNRRFDSYRFIVGPNLADAPLSVLADVLSIDIERILRPSLKWLGHANAADQLFALGELSDAAGLRSGDEVLLLNPAGLAWNMAALTFTNAQTAHRPPGGSDAL